MKLLNWQWGLLSVIIFGLIPVHTMAQNGLHFDGTDDYVQTDFLPPTGSAPRTLEAWIKTADQVGPQAILNYGTLLSYQRFSLGLFDGKLRIGLKDDGYTTAAFLADDKWHHVAVTFDVLASPNYRTYVDGVLSDSFNISTLANTGSAVKLRFGIRLDAKLAAFSGKMDEVRVWDYARSSAQIRAHYNRELCTAEKGLVAYHKLNQGVAGKNNTSLAESVDESSKGNKGTLKNFTLNGSSSNWVQGKDLTYVLLKTIKVSACESYTTSNGKHTWTTSGVYKYTIPNSVGCDSIITVDLTVGKLDATVNQSGNVLTAQEAGKTYQWLDCNNGYAELSGETNRSFTPRASGKYAVRVSDNTCVDTSKCITIVVVGLDEGADYKLAEVFPNPSLGTINVRPLTASKGASLSIIDMSGKMVCSAVLNDDSTTEIELLGKPGVYIVTIRDEHELQRIRVLKQ